jgi:predicted SPOUT superfamily RNA methylase MTH1
MNKYMDKMKARTVKVMMIGCCFTALWTGAAYAETGASTDQRSVVSQETGISDVLLQKQQEIDKYVFEQHADELANKGITVTNTGPVGGVVEIGITPYNEANADHLYGIFGTKIVKVVAGTQAVTLGMAAAPARNDVAATAETPAENALLEKQRQIDSYVFAKHADELVKKGITVTNTGPVGGVVEIGITPYNKANADYLYGIFGTKMVNVVEGQQAVTLGSGSEAVAKSADVAEVAGAAKAIEASKAAEAGLPSFIMAIFILAAAMIVGGAALLVRRHRMAKP